MTDVLGRKQTHPLSLREAVNLSLENNLDIAIASVNPKIMGQTVVEQEAFFDPIFTVTGQRLKNLSPNATNLRDPDGNVIPGFVIQDVKSADWTLDASITQELITGGQLLFQYTFDRQSSKGTALGPLVFSRPLNPSWDGNLKLQIQQPLLKGFGIDVSQRGIHLAQNNRKVSQYQFVTQLMDSMRAIQEAYWTLVLRIEVLKISRQSLLRAEILRRNNEVRVRAGAMAPIELKVAQAEVATQQEGVIIAENAVRIAERELKRLMNVERLSIMTDTALLPTEYPRFESKPIDEAYCIETALQKRPEFAQVKTDLESRKIDIKFYRNGLYPQVDFIGSINFNGLGPSLHADNDMIFDGGLYNGVLGLVLTVPLGGNRAAKAQYAAAQLTAARLLRELKRLELQIVTDVRNTVSSVETNAKRVDTTRVARELRQERLDAAEKQLEVGRITSFEVVTAQEDLARAQGAEIQAIIDYTFSLAALSRQIGTILDELGMEVEEAPILR